MPLDAVFLTALTGELRDRLTGAKIDKVQQPERDMLVLTLRSREGSFRLLLCAGVGSARINITSRSFENPAQPPMFCMLLRKHIVGARIVSLTQPDMERLIIFTLSTVDELGVPAEKRLAVEMMGRASNVVLIGPEGNIIDCMRRVDSDMSSKRQLMPGMLYRLPPAQGRPGFFAASSEELRTLWDNAPDAEADRWLCDSFSGLPPIICRELCRRAFGELSPRISLLTAEQRANFPAMLDAFAETVRRRELTPYMLLQKGEPRDFCYMPLTQYGEGYENVPYGSFSELLDAFYDNRDKQDSMRRKTSSLLKTVKTARDRAARRLSQRTEELRKAGDRDGLRRAGDLITANLYRLRKGDRALETEDWYQEDCPVVRIALDPLKTPSQNAAKYYKDYNRAKSAEQHLTQLITIAVNELDYLDSVVDIILRSESERDVAELRRELAESGYIKLPQTGKREKRTARGHLRFVSDGGFEILVGRSNSENDELTFKTARRTDLWLHAQKIHGSHVIISCGGLEPDDETVAQAASLAAYYSQGRDAGRILVDITQIRNVRKPSGALPGMVIYTEQRSLTAQADKTLAERLKK